MEKFFTLSAWVYSGFFVLVNVAMIYEYCHMTPWQQLMTKVEIKPHAIVLFILSVCWLISHYWN